MEIGTLLLAYFARNDMLPYFFFRECYHNYVVWIFIFRTSKN